MKDAKQLYHGYRFPPTIISHALAADEQLIQVKGQLKHGGFETWCKKHLAFSPRTARLYMQVARNPQVVTDENGNALPICLRDIPRLLNPTNKDEEASSETITVEYEKLEPKPTETFYIRTKNAEEKEPERIPHLHPKYVEEKEPERAVVADIKQESFQVQSIKSQLGRLCTSEQMDITLYMLDVLGYEAVAKAFAKAHAANQYAH